MASIEDTGKVWFKGAFGPEYAVRVGDKVFVPGKKEQDAIECLVLGNVLFIDLHDMKMNLRVGKYFSLDLPTTTPATLFNGFEKTKHADVTVVTYKDEGVKEVVVPEEMYSKKAISDMDSEKFFNWLTEYQQNIS